MHNEHVLLRVFARLNLFRFSWPSVALPLSAPLRWCQTFISMMTNVAIVRLGSHLGVHSCTWSYLASPSLPFKPSLAPCWMEGYLDLIRGLLVFGMDHASAAALALELGMRMALQVHAQEVFLGEGWNDARGCAVQRAMRDSCRARTTLGE